MQHVVRSVRKLHRRRTISSLGTISIERERLHELHRSKEEMCNKVMHILVQQDGSIDFVNNKQM